MKKIVIGNKENIKYDFRETCFGICETNNKLLVVFDEKYKQYSLIGGGKEINESNTDTLKREFKEETGLTIKNIKEFITIDCFWLAGGDYPLESLAHFYIVEIDTDLKLTHEFKYEYIDIDKVDLKLPYQKKAIELYKKTISR